MKKIRLNSELSLLFALALISFAIVFIIKADFGMTVVQAPVYVLSIAVPALSMGSWNYIVQGFLALLMVALVGRIKISYILSFIAAVVYGLFLDAVSKWTAGLLPHSLLERIAFYAAGYILLCVAVAIFFTCKAPLMPYDIFIREVASRYKMSIPKFKWIFDISCVITALTLSLAITGKIRGIGIGTLIFAFTVSPAVSVLMKFINAKFEFKPLLKDKEFPLRKNNR